jgi:hypothetical protein
MLTRVERLRRVVILCESFTRNYAYYRAGWNGAAKRLLRPDHEQASFWRQVNGDLIDIAVLEWCKLFTDFKGKHCWRNVVTDPSAFEAALLSRLGKGAPEYRQVCQAMWKYRSKFVAHLDDEKEAYIPMLDEAWTAVQFYHEHVVTQEGTAADFGGLAAHPDYLTKGYAQCEAEARGIFERF